MDDVLSHMMYGPATSAVTEENVERGTAGQESFSLLAVHTSWPLVECTGHILGRYSWQDL